jgi:glutathione peroxidase
MDAAPEPERRERHDASRRDLYGIRVTTIEGRQQTLDPYRGQALLVVNVASQCGFTPQYAGLEALYRRYRERGFAVLGFPSDQFGHQEPGTEDEIRQFCSLTYDVTFPMFAKVDVNGPGEHPLYALLKSQARGLLGTTAIKWNFTKFLVGRDGRVLKRYASRDTPEDIEKDPAFVAALG